jgi:cytochrome P450
MTSIALEPTTSPRSFPVVGPLFSLRHDRLDAFERMAKLGDAVRFRVMRQTMHLLSHPEHVRHVLVDHPKAYGKQTPGYRIMRKVVGNGLLTSEGDYWLRQRRIAQPAFHKKRIETFAETMVKVTLADLEHWPGSGVVDVVHEMMRLTLTVVSQTLLSRDVSQDADAVGAALGFGLEYMADRIGTPWAMPEWVPTPANLKFKRGIATLNRIVDGMIAERRKGVGQGSGDLLDMLMHSRDEESGEGMNDLQLRDEVLTILLAGHETTAMTLSWTLHLLSQHPEVESKLREEIDALGGRAPTLADFPQLVYAGRVVDESMRLYPPAWIIARSVLEDDLVTGHPVKAGDWIFLSPWILHRRPDLWPDPTRFDPDRFLPEAVAARHRYAFLPFSAGQRKCIGDQFALMEARLLLVTVLQHLRFEAVPGAKIEPVPSITLRPRSAGKAGLPMRVTPIAPISRARPTEVMSSPA